jgi:hypothetical protein
MRDYCFVINVYKDQELATKLIDRLLDLYPDCVIKVLLDGTQYTYQHPRVSVKAFERVKIAEYGALWLIRYINEGLMGGCKYIVKIDPDTLIIDRFMEPPNADIFGAVIKFPHGSVPTGGIFGMKTDVAKRIMANHKYWTSQRKYKGLQGYPRYTQNIHPHEEIDTQPVIIEELILCDIIKRLSLSVSTWDGIANRFRPVYTDQEIATLGSVSAVHPYLGAK